MWRHELQKLIRAEVDLVDKMEERDAIERIRPVVSVDFSSLEIKGIVDATQITNVKKTGFRDSRDVVRHEKS